MTPQDIFDYRMKWRQRQNQYAVRLHSDLRNTGVSWCRTQLFSQQWDLKTFTNVYQHTFYFEYKQDYDQFKIAMPTEFIDQNQ